MPATDPIDEPSAVELVEPEDATTANEDAPPAEPDAEPVEPVEREGEDADTDAEGEDAATADPRLAKVRREARGLRERLRATEAERDGVAARLERFQTAEAIRWASDELIEPRDLFVTGVTVAELVDDAGDLDHDKVTAAARKVAADRPHWRKSPPPVGKPVPRLSGGGDPTTDDAPTWGALLKRI